MRRRWIRRRWLPSGARGFGSERVDEIEEGGDMIIVMNANPGAWADRKGTRAKRKKGRRGQRKERHKNEMPNKDDPKSS
jgi:hypothetical protein